MPEGPEVRRHAERLAKILDGRKLVEVGARTKQARAWLEAHPGAFESATVRSVRARGKHLVVRLARKRFFHSHLMMWGRWQIFERPCEYDSPGGWTPDRRERARLLTETHAAVLFSAPIFEIGEGDPYETVENLRSLGPDTLPYPDEKVFDVKEWKRRMRMPENAMREIGAALLDQRICCGLGNYLRAEVLFACRLGPWKRVTDLEPEDWECLAEQIPGIARHAYLHNGATVSEGDRERMRNDETLVYQPNREGGTRHWVFRRTNLPCLVCGGPVRQKRQTTWVKGADDDGDLNDGALQGRRGAGSPDAKGKDEEKTRIIYFCPHCQNTSVELPAIKLKKISNKILNSENSVRDTVSGAPLKGAYSPLRTV